MNVNNYLDEYIDQLYPELVSWRRYLHQHPELSFQEEKTSAWLYDKLIAFGCNVKRSETSYGLIVTIKGKLSGPTIAIRADIDALPIHDEKDVEYRSSVDNVMHACGHDGHTATLLGIAKYYIEHRDQLKGERRLIFQPAEELSPGGAKTLIDEGVLEGVDAVYGVHLWSPLDLGKISTKSEYFMSAVDDFQFVITGKGGHGGMPQDTVDSILVGSAIVQNLQTIVSRNVNPIKPAVVTIGTFQAGHANNVIAERAVIKGTIRTFDEETRQMIINKVQSVSHSIAEAYGAELDITLKYGYPAVYNDAEEAKRILQLAEAYYGTKQVSLAEPLMIAEDFSYYLQKKRGCFFFVGAGNKQNAIYPHHHPKFDFDEQAMKQAMKMLILAADTFE